MARRTSIVLLAVIGALLVGCGGGTGVRIVRATPSAGGPGGAPTVSATAGATATATATATPVPLPPRPDNPFSGGLAVSAYLAGGRADIAHCLPELVSAWDLAPVDGDRCVSADIDGDGKDELAFLVTIADDPQPAGEVWFFDDASTGYRFFSSARALANQVLTGVAIAGVADLTGDGKPDIVITAVSCDAAAGGACSTNVIIASEHTGTLQNLAPPDSALVATTDVKVEDANGDGLSDVVMKSDASAVPGPGPQSGVTRELAWTGIDFAVHDTPGEPVYLINLINMADAAYRSGDLPTARKLYEQAATDTTLKDWKAETGEYVGRRELVPYALFREALVAQRQGDPAATRNLLTRASVGHENAMLGLVSAAYLSALDAGQPPPQSCTAAKQSLALYADAFARFWNYGYANPEHTIADLC